MLPSLDAPGFAAQWAERYRVEPYMIPFADFENSSGLEVLEIGLGLGADHGRFALSGARLHGIDITIRAIEITGRRLKMQGPQSDLRLADAEELPFESESFALDYSWGEIHHSPDTALAAREILCVLQTWRPLLSNDLPHLEFGGIHALVALRTGTTQAH